MGHDIYAYRTSEAERDAAYRRFEERVAAGDEVHEGPLDGEAWLRAYDDYATETRVAYLRRSAFDECNRAIYEAFDCVDLYGGCSGNGSDRTFTLAQVERALESLPGIAAGRPPNMADDMLQALSGQFAAKGDEFKPAPSHPDDMLAREYEFLTTVLAWMREGGRDSITISFG